jgi:hypothetical protein
MRNMQNMRNIGAIAAVAGLFALPLTVQAQGITGDAARGAGELISPRLALERGNVPGPAAAVAGCRNLASTRSLARIIGSLARKIG